MATLQVTTIAKPAVFSGHAGAVLARRDSYTIAATLSAGDIIQFHKIPAGARILAVRVDTSLASQITVEFGDNQNASAYIASTSIGSTQTNATRSGYDKYVSVSDGAADKFVTMQAKINANASNIAAGTIALQTIYLIETLTSN